MKDQQFTEEKPLLPESRGQETEMVSVCVFMTKYSRPVINGPPFLGKRTKKLDVCVCMIKDVSMLTKYHISS